MDDSFEAQFQSVSDPPDPFVTKITEEIRAYEHVFAIEPKLTIPSDFQQAIIRRLEYGESPAPNGVPTSTEARYNVSHQRFQLSSPQTILPTNIGPHSCVIHTEAEKEPHPTFFLQYQKFA